MSLPFSLQDLIRLMEEDQGEYPDSLLYHFPSQVRLDALPELVDISISRTLLTALLTALKANGNLALHESYFILEFLVGAFQNKKILEGDWMNLLFLTFQSWPIRFSFCWLSRSLHTFIFLCGFSEQLAALQPSAFITSKSWLVM